MADVTVRGYQSSDFTYIVTKAAQTGWLHLTPREQRLTSPDAVGRRASSMIYQALNGPEVICLIAEVQGRPIGYQLVMPHADEVSGIRSGLKLDGWLDPSARGQGISQRIHGTTESICRQMGLPRMTCIVAAHTEPALKPTSSRGFVTERVMRAKWL
jgi:GNAT superfamily N-acetyltransferase